MTIHARTMFRSSTMLQSATLLHAAASSCTNLRPFARALDVYRAYSASARRMQILQEGSAASSSSTSDPLSTTGTAVYPSGSTKIKQSTKEKGASKDGAAVAKKDGAAVSKAELSKGARSRAHTPEKLSSVAVAEEESNSSRLPTSDEKSLESKKAENATTEPNKSSSECSGKGKDGATDATESVQAQRLPGREERKSKGKRAGKRARERRRLKRRRGEKRQALAEIREKAAPQSSAEKETDPDKTAKKVRSGMSSTPSASSREFDRTEEGQVALSSPPTRSWFSLKPFWSGSQEDVQPTQNESRADTTSAESMSNTSNRFVKASLSTRATINANLMDDARQRQPDSGPESRFNQANAPLGSGNGLQPHILDFSQTTMIYPPRDVYPPPLPRLRDADLDMAGRALGVLRISDVQWIDAKAGGEYAGHWRPIARDASWHAANAEFDRTDSEQSLEYVGDSLLHLLSRSALMTRFPRRAIYLYNSGANFMVSNDVFGHVFKDAGLNEERAAVADILQERSKQTELRRVADQLTPEQLNVREKAPLPGISFSRVHHLRQADLFEAYVGAVYLVLGFQEASKWCTRLFEPWLDRLERTPSFGSPKHLTQDGEEFAKMEQVMRDKVWLEQRQELAQNVQRLSAPKRWSVAVLQRILGKDALF